MIKSVENRVKMRRKKLKMSQEQLAEVAGVSQSEISAIETGKVTPTVYVALVLANALSTTGAALFSIEDQKPPK